MKKEHSISLFLAIPLLAIIAWRVHHSITPDVISTPAILRQASLVLENQTPYAIVAAIHLPTARQTERTEGWYLLQPAETKILTYSFEREPAFQLYAETRSPEAVHWLHRKINKQGTVYFQGQGGSGIGHPISYITHDLAQIQESDWSGNPVDTREVAFFNVPIAADGRATFAFRDPALPNLVDMTGFSLNDSGESQLISSRAVELSQSIARQLASHAKFPSLRYAPFLIGADVKDSNGRGGLGVVVTRADAETIFGDPTLFAVGDLITGVSDGNGVIQSVFSPDDITWLLFEHATNSAKGINVPIKVRLLRGENELIGETPFKFNLSCPNCWPGELNGVKACFVAAFNAWTFGGGPWVEVGLGNIYGMVTQTPVSDSSLRHFLIIQRNGRLRQFAERTTSWCENLAMFGLLPTVPRFIAERLLAGTLFRTGAMTVLTSVALDTAEGAAWVVQCGSPARSRSDIQADVKKATPINAGLSLVVGTFTQVHMKAPRGRELQ